MNVAAAASFWVKSGSGQNQGAGRRVRDTQLVSESQKEREQMDFGNRSAEPDRRVPKTAAQSGRDKTTAEVSGGSIESIRTGAL